MKPQHCATPCDCCTCTHAPLLPPPCPLHLAPPPRLPRRAPTAHLRVQHFPPPPPPPPPALRPSPPRAARFTKATSRLTRRAFTSSPPSPHRICLARLVQHPTPRPSSAHECITAFRCTRARRARRTSHPTTSRSPLSSLSPVLLLPPPLSTPLAPLTRHHPVQHDSTGTATADWSTSRCHPRREPSMSPASEGSRDSSHHRRTHIGHRACHLDSRPLWCGALSAPTRAGLAFASSPRFTPHSALSQ